MARTSKSDTRHHSLYLTIRQNLLRGAFPPGYRFKLNEICAEYTVSVSVVREALTRLSGQGLVRLEPNKGFSVPTFTIDEINDLAHIRGEVEALALTLAIERGTIEWETRVVAAHHRLANTPNASLADDPEANERWTEAHRAFHAACAGGCESPTLIGIREPLYDRSEIIRQMAKLTQGRRRNVAAEHEAIMKAAVGRNTETAVRLIRKHVDITRQACVNAWTAEYAKVVS